LPKAEVAAEVAPALQEQARQDLVAAKEELAHRLALAGTP